MTRTIEEFTTFEAEVERLNEICGLSLPSLSNGSIGFFRAIPGWLSGRLPAGTAVVLTEPSLNLALPYGRDEIAMAMGLAGLPNDVAAVTKHAESFCIRDELLDRPVSALSGGEQMLLSLCKAAALSARCERIVLCSPFFWLDSANRARVTQVMDMMNQKQGVAHLLLLLGEDGGEGSVAEPAVDAVNSFAWSLSARRLTVTYPAAVFPRAAAEKVIEFRTQEGRLGLQSPTLLAGPNGAGKTTLAKVLSGLISPTTGSVEVQAKGFSGRARLLLQDPLLHFFGESPSGQLVRVFRCADDKRKAAAALFEKLQKDCASLLSPIPGAVVGALDDPNSMLQAKLALVAERLVVPAPLLILDEPAWCLSRPLARAYVSVVAKECHERGTALLIISHRNEWWQGIVKDRLLMTPVGEAVELSIGLP